MSLELIKPGTRIDFIGQRRLCAMSFGLSSTPRFGRNDTAAKTLAKTLSPGPCRYDTRYHNTIGASQGITDCSSRNIFNTSIDVSKSLSLNSYRMFQPSGPKRRRS